MGNEKVRFSFPICYTVFNIVTCNLVNVSFTLRTALISGLDRLL